MHLPRASFKQSTLTAQDLPRCSSLLASTLAVALRLPPGSPVRLLRARATSLEFSLLPPTDPNDPDEEVRPDKDVLPTLLAYRNGELQKTWIRVDWEVGEDGVEGLLRRYVRSSNDMGSLLIAGAASWLSRRCLGEAGLTKRTSEKEPPIDYRIVSYTVIDDAS